MTYKSSVAVTALVAAVAIAGQASAKERLNFAYGYPNNSAIGLAVDAYAEAVAERSDGEVDVTGFAMSLLSLPETSPGVRDGLADVGFVLPPYYPAEYSTNLFLHEMNLLVNLVEEPTGKEPLAFTGAMVEYTFTKCPECLEEYSAQNQVYTGGGVTPLYNLLCKDVKVTSVEDLNGLRLRAGGAGFVRFAEAFGAQGVRLPVSEAYEALDQGIIDCAMLSAPELTNYNLHEVVTDITLAVPGGVFAGVSSANVNADRWKGMDDASREALLWGGSQMTAHTTWNFYTDDAAAIEHARGAGINIHEPDAELLAAVKEFSRQDLKTVSALFKDTYDVARADEIAADFEPLLAKWNDLVVDVDSADALNQVIWDQVISKVDPATYAQ
ncbi:MULTISPECIES: C4-dicarboxylate TRAP transporter substrate-binding protein [Sulfitobacter]|jgi:TRAP-type C4-dicarboxylate transport system substrate-binding protein|uniref:C4-dicarboxylate TRAP transporter substrate-binding protein n=1 Tax=Sulfitobacter TaxID=60136 RepID=UPI000326316B|nr:C4-dicarboxylate TRAP transporter substrate-binding protein [Sulfitobacter sp. NAS-14.1]PTB92347.1 C4-dicarboxylate ABC transporter substrate-binding protein [Marinobacter sp. B9-2]